MTSATAQRHLNKRLLTHSEQVLPWAGDPLSFLTKVPELVFFCHCTSSQLMHSFVPSRDGQLWALEETASGTIVLKETVGSITDCGNTGAADTDT